MLRVPSWSRSSFANKAEAAFFTSARSSVPSLSVSNIWIGAGLREPAKAGRLPTDNVATAKVSRTDRRDVMTFLPEYRRVGIWGGGRSTQSSKEIVRRHRR